MKYILFLFNNYSVLLILLPFFCSFSQTPIGDEIGGMVLNKLGNPYIIEKDLYISKYKKAIIKEGVILLFKQFTGINVNGSLIVEGTANNSVIFTSINDNEYNTSSTQLPNAFDWNGIYISDKSGEVKLENFKLSYSVYGIKSEKEDITITNGLFKQSGQNHCTIKDNIQFVQDNIPYNKKRNREENYTDISFPNTIANPADTTKPLTTKEIPPNKKKTIIGGEIGNKILDSINSPYVVDNNITVSKGKRLILKQGAILLFKPFTGIIINGSLYIEGTTKKPIVLTSINEKYFNDSANQEPGRFDWNGISILKDAKEIKLKNFKIAYSTIGIISNKKDIAIDNGIFNEIGRASVTINENIQNVTYNTPFSYEVKKDTTPPEGKTKNKTITSFAFLGAGLLSGGVSLYGGVKANNYLKTQREINNSPVTNLDSLSNEWNKYASKRKSARVLSVLTGISCVSLTTVSVILLKRKTQSTIGNKISFSVDPYDMVATIFFINEF